MRMIELSRSIALASLLALAACGTGAGGNKTDADVVAAVGDEKTEAKLGAYTEAYNGLVGTFGLAETTESYLKADIPHAAVSDSITISNGWVETNTNKLKEAQALPGDLGALDTAAGKLEDALNKVNARLGPLYAYYNSKAYRQDSLAKGKAEDAAMRAEFDAASKALDGFNTELQRLRDASLERELATLKDSGDMAGYNTKLALQRTRQLIDLFDKPEDVKNEALLAKADGIAASLDTLLADQRKAVADAKAKATEPMDKARISSYSTVENMLGSALGSYRQMRQTKNPDDMQNTISSYNHAVESANRIR